MEASSSPDLSSSLIITVGEARKILGADANNRTDEQIAKEIIELNELAHILLNTSFLPKKTIY